MTDDVFHAIAKYDNLCKYIHLPVQSGASNAKRMNRGYTREWYMDRIAAIRRIIRIASCRQISLLDSVEKQRRASGNYFAIERGGIILAYHFKYSERPRTLAERKYEDDVPESVKGERLTEIIEVQRSKLSRELKVWWVNEGSCKDCKRNPKNFAVGHTYNSMVSSLRKMLRRENT